MTATETADKPTTKTASQAAAPKVSEATPVSYLDLMEQASDAWIQGLVESQTAALAATKAALDSFNQPVDLTPSVAPVVAALPTLREVVDSNFAFADKYLMNQKEFAAKLLELHGA
jgi:hypothetical protein